MPTTVFRGTLSPPTELKSGLETEISGVPSVQMTKSKAVPCLSSLGCSPLTLEDPRWVPPLSPYVFYSAAKEMIGQGRKKAH